MIRVTNRSFSGRAGHCLTFLSSAQKLMEQVLILGSNVAQTHLPLGGVPAWFRSLDGLEAAKNACAVRVRRAPPWVLIHKRESNMPKRIAEQTDSTRCGGAAGCRISRLTASSLENQGTATARTTGFVVHQLRPFSHLLHEKSACSRVLFKIWPKTGFCSRVYFTGQQVWEQLGRGSERRPEVRIMYIMLNHLGAQTGASLAAHPRALILLTLFYRPLYAIYKVSHEVYTGISAADLTRSRTPPVEPGQLRPCLAIFLRMNAICVCNGNSFGQTSLHASSVMQPNTPSSSPTSS